jgi:O-antigen ligase
MKSNFSRWTALSYTLVCQFLWAGALIALPITSYPLLVKLTPSSTVAPLSAIFFAALGLVWLLPHLFRGGMFPAESRPLLWFVLAVVVAWAASFFGAIPAFRERSNLTAGFRAFVTLGVGLLAYFVPAAWLSADRKNLQRTVVLINLVGAGVIAWSMVQAYFVVFNHGEYPFKLVQFQWLFSSRNGDPLIQSRVTGFAYEPSWLAHQLNLVFLPIWLAATLMGYSAHRKIWRLSLENVLLLGGLFILYLSASRIGWLSFLLVVASQALVWNLKLARHIQGTVTARVHIRPAWDKVARVAVPAVLLVCFGVLYIALGLGMLRLGAGFEPRLAQILKKNPFAADSFYAFTNELVFAERTVYWGAGLEIFASHPFLGVGLGNAGFYFPEKMPAYGWGLVEINKLFNYWSDMPNIKSLWVRIPAETGLVGFGIFLGWFYLLWQSTRLGRSSSDLLLRTLAWAGTFAWIAYLIEGFSVDSLALPYFWFAMALVSAVRSRVCGCKASGGYRASDRLSDG